MLAEQRRKQLRNNYALFKTNLPAGAPKADPRNPSSPATDQIRVVVGAEQLRKQLRNNYALFSQISQQGLQKRTRVVA